MNYTIVKEEEQYQQTPPSQAKTLFSLTANNENAYYYSQHQKVIHKFLSAYNRLIEQQAKESNSPTIKYPIVLGIDYIEFYVHCGNHQLELTNKNKLLHCQHQMLNTYQYQCYQAQLDSQQTKIQGIRHQIHKKKELNFLQEQKDTKNIPKNYCKAIISFAQKNQHYCLHILKDQVKVLKFLEKISVYKKKLLNIKTFSSLLIEGKTPEEEEFSRTFRILSRLFIKKFAINYIFNSKIVQHNWHIRYREKIYKGIKNPKNFSHIKNL